MINYLRSHFLGLEIREIKTSIAIDINSHLESNVHEVTYGHQ